MTFEINRFWNIPEDDVYARDTCPPGYRFVARYLGISYIPKEVVEKHFTFPEEPRTAANDETAFNQTQREIFEDSIESTRKYMEENDKETLDEE
jgi:hypothetical protein